MDMKLEKYSHILQGIYFGYNEVIGESVAEVLGNLPEDERDYFINNCWVISLNKGASWPVELLKEKEWIVMLANDLDGEEARSVISRNSHMSPDTVYIIMIKESNISHASVFE